MRLTLLGTGAAAQVPVYNCDCPACERARSEPEWRRGPCCALLSYGDSQWLIDAGLTGLSTRFPPGTLQAIIQTHYHADHAQGLLHLRWGKNLRIPVLGPQDPEGFADLYKHPGILDFSTALKPFEPYRLAPELELTPVPLVHSKPTLGYVFEGKSVSMAYLTDTVGLPRETQRYFETKPLDFLVIDCSYPPRPQAPRNHNDLTRVLDAIAGLPIKQVVLTHIGHEFDAWLMQNPQAFPGHIVVGHDGLCLQVAGGS
jgi:phosphoribosyl 1,2-cyclic phosphate phosphodiesterase